MEMSAGRYVVCGISFQERLAKCHGSQCGFCTPGMVMSIYALLRNHPEPTSEQMMAALAGKYCPFLVCKCVPEAFLQMLCLCEYLSVWVYIPACMDDVLLQTVPPRRVATGCTPCIPCHSFLLENETWSCELFQLFKTSPYVSSEVLKIRCAKMMSSWRNSCIWASPRCFCIWSWECHKPCRTGPLQ